MKLSYQDIGNLDKSISDLFECHPLPEAEVKFISEKVFIKFVVYSNEIFKSFQLINNTLINS